MTVSKTELFSAQVFLYYCGCDISFPKANGSLARNHLFQSLASTGARYPNCGLLVTGDFNHLNFHVFLDYFRLKQIVKLPTRTKATLDLILNKMHEYYSPHKQAHCSGCPITLLLWELLRTEGTILTEKSYHEA